MIPILRGNTSPEKMAVPLDQFVDENRDGIPDVNQQHFFDGLKSMFELYKRATGNASSQSSQGGGGAQGIGGQPGGAGGE